RKIKTENDPTMSSSHHLSIPVPRKIYTVICILVFSLIGVAGGFSQGTAFTYQGRISSSGSPASGNFDFTFSLFNANSGGSQVGGTLTYFNVGVTNGIFNVALDFGNVFDGSQLWLQIGLK